MTAFALGSALMMNLKLFSQALSTVDPSIRIIWTKLTLHAIYLDLSLQISQNTIQYEVYRKPGNSFAFLPMGSIRVRKTFPLVVVGWLSSRDSLRRLSPVQKQAREFDVRCVWSCANAVGIREQFASCDLNLVVIYSNLSPTKISKVVNGAKCLSLAVSIDAMNRAP